MSVGMVPNAAAEVLEPTGLDVVQLGDGVLFSQGLSGSPDRYRGIVAATIKKRFRILKDGSQSTSYQVPYKNSAGKSVYKDFKKSSDARRFQGTIVGSVESGTHVSGKVPILSGAAQIWLNACTTVGRNGRQPVETSTLRS